MASLSNEAETTGWRRWLPQARRRERRLRLVETLALGDRRFVAIVAADGREYLVGGSLHSLGLLTELPRGAAPDGAQ